MAGITNRELAARLEEGFRRLDDALAEVRARLQGIEERLLALERQSARHDALLGKGGKGNGGGNDNEKWRGQIIEQKNLLKMFLLAVALGGVLGGGLGAGLQVILRLLGGL